MACDELEKLDLEYVSLMSWEKIDSLSEEEQQSLKSELEGIIQRFHANGVCGVGYDVEFGEKDDTHGCIERPAGSN